MSIDKELSEVSPVKDTMLTIGVFDGVHLGHQYLLNYLKEKAKAGGLLSGVITFKTHPQSTSASIKSLAWLNNFEERLKLIKNLGIDIIVALDFNPEIKQLGARDFMQKLKTYLRVKGLVVGPDFALGKNREGTIEYLRRLGSEMDFTVDVVPPYINNEEVVRSSRIRRALNTGDVIKVNRFLGRSFSISGIAVSGDHRGRILGFPTVNLEVTRDMAVPAKGVYATITRVHDKAMPSVTNIGVRPTFGGGKQIIETHILDFQGHLVGEKIEVSFLDRLRDEKKFDNAEDLISQIKKDVERARAVLSKYNI